MKTPFKTLTLCLGLFAVQALAAPPADGMLTTQIKLALWTTANLRSTAVHVDTNDATVTLYGKVPTLEQRARAEKTTRDIKGVASVNNLLQVVADTEAKPTALADKTRSRRSRRRSSCRCWRRAA